MEKMTNPDAQDRHLTPLEISTCLDSLQTLAPARSAHLRSCRMCTDRIAQLRLLRGAIHSMPREAPIVDLASRVMNEIQRPRRHESWWAPIDLSGAAPFALAASLVVIVGAIFGSVIAQPPQARSDEQAFSYLAVFAPSPFGYPCEDRASCRITRSGL